MRRGERRGREEGGARRGERGEGRSRRKGERGEGRSRRKGERGEREGIGGRGKGGEGDSERGGRGRGRKEERMKPREREEGRNKLLYHSALCIQSLSPLPLGFVALFTSLRSSLLLLLPSLPFSPPPSPSPICTISCSTVRTHSNLLAFVINLLGQRASSKRGKRGSTQQCTEGLTVSG